MCVRASIVRVLLMFYVFLFSIFGRRNEAGARVHVRMMRVESTVVAEGKKMDGWMCTAVRIKRTAALTSSGLRRRQPNRFRFLDRVFVCACVVAERCGCSFVRTCTSPSSSSPLFPRFPATIFPSSYPPFPLITVAHHRSNTPLVLTVCVTVTTSPGVKYSGRFFDKNYTNIRVTYRK